MKPATKWIVIVFSLILILSLFSCYSPIKEYLSQDLYNGLNELNRKLDILYREYGVVNNYMDTNLKYEDKVDPTTGKTKSVRVPPPPGYNVNLNDVLKRLSEFPAFTQTSISVEDVESTPLPYL